MALTTRSRKLQVLEPIKLDRRRNLMWAMGAFVGTRFLTSHAKSMSDLPSEGLDLVFPRLADTGNAVPLQVKVTAPAGLLIRSLKVILPENPNPLALHIKVSVPTANYQISTRLRLAASQSVWVLAQFNDDSERANSAPTVITSTACLDDS
jgi:predicted secreted protein